MEQCEAHKDEHCHWIPNSVITKHHCGDCQPICRSVRHSLNFVQFSIGAFWFMFSMPVAEVSLPLVISDSLREEFQVCANTILHVYTLDHMNIIHVTAHNYNNMLCCVMLISVSLLLSFCFSLSLPPSYISLSPCLPPFLSVSLPPSLSVSFFLSLSLAHCTQGIMMGITVASSELLQGITPLWCKYTIHEKLAIWYP